MARGAKRKVKTKAKRQKPPRNKNKGPIWVVKGGKVVREREVCPKCGPGNFMADHYDRMHCGRCGYTMFKKTGKVIPAKHKAR
ncbi:MAG: 30S ribosomal protein S27ae [Promethearchaeota archaeon]